MKSEVLKPAEEPGQAKVAIVAGSVAAGVLVLVGIAILVRCLIKRRTSDQKGENPTVASGPTSDPKASATGDKETNSEKVGCEAEEKEDSVKGEAEEAEVANESGTAGQPVEHIHGDEAAAEGVHKGGNDEADKDSLEDAENRV